jgi:hypothetical protein
MNSDETSLCRPVVAANPTAMADYQNGRIGRIADG